LRLATGPQDIRGNANGLIMASSSSIVYDACGALYFVPVGHEDFDRHAQADRRPESGQGLEANPAGDFARPVLHEEANSVRAGYVFVVRSRQGHGCAILSGVIGEAAYRTRQFGATVETGMGDVLKIVRREAGSQPCGLSGGDCHPVAAMGTWEEKTWETR
jgi:hypothetical protein